MIKYSTLGNTIIYTKDIYCNGLKLWRTFSKRSCPKHKFLNFKLAKCIFDHFNRRMQKSKNVISKNLFFGMICLDILFKVLAKTACLNYSTKAHISSKDKIGHTKIKKMSCQNKERVFHFIIIMGRTKANL